MTSFERAPRRRAPVHSHGVLTSILSILAGLAFLPPAWGATPGLDACSLLRSEEVTKLVPGGRPKASVSHANGGPTAVCDWDIPGGGLPTLQVSVTPDSPALKQGLGANRDSFRYLFLANIQENHGRALPDLGDLAKVESVIPLSAEATVILGTTWIEVEFSGNGARAKQDEVVALARAVVARLGSQKR